MKVRNMTSSRGNTVANQFIIDGPFGATTFQSYQTVIARKEADGRVVLDRGSWDYSVTTSKYRNQFLGESKKETKAKIDSGVYELADLN